MGRIFWAIHSTSVPKIARSGESASRLNTPVHRSRLDGSCAAAW